ncbi:uncharacterized protein MYCFIDRAFT_205161 [Pseudocercospora fijiensis CIRAD86]|uniref:hydroxymethylglutaryl-CoA lyase n=1 Tax=Pseudocercospora fijiensis (strain CIRAD86) TaxID=383855 RepID=M3AMU5_PSEFD|nr:uncharacterized protein MYCFIDRAFT_205161 [Pseudocercospora fijiensis CIRAD86]EME78747.1 hypothetical protein MYCFIDRAFT_205161 [Pseudocercospora fijiensis CIRAD86]
MNADNQNQPPSSTSLSSSRWDLWLSRGEQDLDFLDINKASAVRILEVGPRDGLQNIKAQVPTQTKVELIRRLAHTGLRNIEATSFVSPKWIPQLADSQEVLQAAQAIGEPLGVWLPVLTPNMKGLERAVQNQAREVVVFASASEGFSWKNTNCSIEDALQRAEEIVKAAKAHGIRARGVVSCVVACPYDGPTDPKQVLDVAKRFLEMGCYEVGLGETIGVATPHDIEELLRVLLAEIPAEKLAGHYHDTYGQAIANVVKSYEMGLRAFDSSVAGLGGCPYAKGAKGNLSTEDMVYTFEKAGIPTGIDLQQLSEIGDWISKEIGIPNNSRAGSAVVAKSQSKENTAVSKQENHVVKSPEWSLLRDAGDYKVQRADHAVRITLTRAKNGTALTNDMVEGITRTFKDLASDPTVFHIILDAEGKYFCTGMDLSGGGASASNDPAEKSEYYGKVEALYEAIDHAPQTTIAVVDGPSYGGGVGLAFVCDVRLLSSNARFTMTEIQLGLSPAIISKYMIREWGIPFLREAMLAGREVKPDELHRIGVVHGTASSSQDLQELTSRYLRDLRKCAPRSAAACKQLVRLGWRDPGGAEQQHFVTKVFAGMMQPGSEGEHGLAQFRQKIKSVDWGQFHAMKSIKTAAS